MDSYKIDHLQNKRIAEAARKLNGYPNKDFYKQNTVIEKPSSIKKLQIISDQIKEPIVHIAEDESPKQNPKDVNDVKSLLESVKLMKPKENISSENIQTTKDKNTYPVNYTNNLINEYEDILYKIDSCLTTSSFEEEYNSNY